MSNKVELSVKSQLDQIIADMDGLTAKAREVTTAMQESGRDVGDSYKKQVKDTETFLGNLRNTSRRLADQIKSDFKSLVSLNAITDSLKLSNQFKGSIKESINLGDTIRKLGRTFDIADDKRANFHNNMVKGLGEVGLASEVGINSMQGLVDTTVRGEESILAYAKLSGQLASLSGSKGKEADISGGVARVIQAKGGDANDISEMKTVMEDVRKAFVATGKSPADILGNMEKIFTSMSSDMRKTIGTEGLAKLAASGQAAGPGSIKFLEEFMGKSSIQRKAMEAQGFQDVFTSEGIDVDKFQKASQEVLSRVGGDPRMAAKTLGLTDEAAEGFVRLAENLDRVRKVQDDMEKSTGSITEQYRKNMGLGEALSANLNKVKGAISGPFAKIQEMAVEGLSAASESTVGSAGVILGGGILASVMAGAGLKGVGKGLGIGGFAKAKAMEGLTGEKVQNVYVVNANEISGGTGLPGIGKKAGGLLGGAGKFLGKAGLVAGAGAAGYGVGTAINKYGPTLKGKTSEGFEGGAIERLFFKMDKLFGGEASTQFMKSQKVLLELKSKELKKSKQPSRGASFK